MSPEQFVLIADAFPDPMFLVSGDGVVLASNQAVWEQLRIQSDALLGRKLSDITADPPGDVTHYLRLCSRSRKPVLGALVLRDESGGIVCRAEGNVLRPKTEASEALVLVRLIPKRTATTQFVALNLRIEELGREIQRRQRAEQDAREQAERLRTTLASVGDGVITTDAGGRVTNMNAVAESLSGWTNAEAMGQPLDVVFRIVNEETRQTVESPVTKALREGSVVGLANHTILIVKDGTQRHIDDSAAPIRCKDGEIVGCVLIFRDISEKRRAEQQLADDAALIRSVLNHVMDGIITIDDSGTVESFNPGAEKVFGYKAEEVIGHNVKMLMPEPFHGEHDRYLANYLRTGQAKIIGIGREVVGRRKDGSTFPMDLGVSGAFLRHGRRYFTGIVRDISERKRVEKALQESEARFRMLADNIPQLAWIADAGTDGQVHWFNQSWLDYTGTTLEEMKGSGWQKVHHPEHAERVIKKFQHHVKMGLDWEDTFPLRDKNGHFRWFLSRMTVIRDDSGKAMRMFGTNTDITEQREAAVELRRLAAELSEVDRRKDEFLATLAHELRNPLAPVRNAVEILRRQGLTDPKMQWATQIIDRQTRAMARLIDDLMDLSRINQGKIELKRERVELAQVIESAIETSRPLIEEMGHELTVTLPPDRVIVHVDPTRLSQVLLNLLNNAAKYTERGGRIDLRAELTGSELVISLRDTGIGIPADKLPSIFEMFSQVEGALSRSRGGLGIGLSLVKRLVEMHGGNIEAKSGRPGQGSEFIVRLPIVMAQTHPRKTSDDGDMVTPTSELRVLVVDDNRDAAESLAMLLKMMGNNVRTAHDGQEAVAAAGEFRPHVVLCDIGLPKLNGYQACRQMKAQAWDEKMILIAVTGWGQDNDRRQSEEAGFAHHLTKPVDPQALMKLLAGLDAVKV